MSADYLKRFDWGLAARIQAMNASELAALLAERLPACRAGGRRPFCEALGAALQSERPVAEIVDELLDEGCTLSELRNDAVYDLCLEGEDVRLDGSAPWDEILAGQSADVLSSLDVLPGTDEELFLLLEPRCLDAIVRSLEPESPRSPQADAIARLRQACTSRPDLLVAYCFDA
jgi:hypothetical protein